MAAMPEGDWAGRELADLLGIKPHNMITQLAKWVRLGLLTKTGPSRYALPTQQTIPDRNPLNHHVIDTRRPGLTT
jgi:hypothetical protein